MIIIILSFFFRFRLDSPFICPWRTGCSVRALHQKCGNNHKSGHGASQNQTVMIIRMVQAGHYPVRFAV